MKEILVISAILLTAVVANAQSPIGFWETIDDDTGERKSVVEIYQTGDKLDGAVRELLLKPADTLCDACTGDKKNAPVVGMKIITDMETSSDQWKGGVILDPETGKEYKCVLWFEDGAPDVLKVRGKHWTGLYRTQDWHRRP